MAMEAMNEMTSPLDGDGGNATTKSAAKAFATKYRGIMMRPMTTAVSKAQMDFKTFVTNPEEIDHNLYGKFLGILKDAGVPWKARRLPESREDAMHIMNAMVAAINAYQHYQKDVERSYHEIESSMASNKTHSHNQAADVSKLGNEVTMLRKKLAGTENALAKQGNDLKGQITSLKSKLAQTERDLNDSQIHARKLEKKLQLEKKQADHLMSKIMTADKPKFGKAAKAAARSPNGTAAAELSVAVDNSENSVGNRSPSLIPHIKNSAGTPNKPSGSRSPLPWLDNDEEALERPQRHEFRSETNGATTASPGASPENAVQDQMANGALAPLKTIPASPTSRVGVEGGKAAQAASVVHKVQVTAASPESTVSGSLSDEEALDEEVSPGSMPKSKNRFKKFLKALKISTKKEGKEGAPAAKSQSSTFLSRDNSATSHSTTMRC